ncbi:MAG TPA: PHP domain-containing protein [Candidatus Limnocylindrales bacterium]|nr:PHP domain-containing protein [Candidatus Limnocylindrales bacterium]
MASFAELHCHSNFSFLDGASAADELVARAVELGLSALALTDHQGLYGAVRFSSAAEEVGLRPIVGLEVELLDAAAPDPARIVLPRRRRSRPGHRGQGDTDDPAAAAPNGGSPVRPRADRLRLPGHREARREELRGIGDGQRGPHLVLLARDAAGYRSLCRLVSAANLAGSKGVPRFDQALLARHAEGLVALSGCRQGEIARRLLAGDREGAAAVARRYAALFAPPPGVNSGFLLELQHHLLPDDDFLVTETVGLAGELGLPVVVSNDAHYARPEDRELQDVLVCIRHGLSLEESAHLRRPNGEYQLKSAEELARLPPAQPDAGPAVRRAWAEGLRVAGEVAEHCRVELGFERYRFPGFPVPNGETAFSHLERLCHDGVRRRYHPMTPAVLKQLAHELEVIERTGLAEFFLICWDLMRFARERGIPAQGRGSAGDSIVAYALGITRVDPIRHRLLFERFINEGRTAYPDVDIDFASSRREEVIQYVYQRYGPQHTGMVCNVVTYRARSAVREVGYALGFPRPLVDRVAKALETYDSVMVRRDLEADGGFAEFFASPGEGPAAVPEAAAAARAGERGLVDGMGRLERGPRRVGGPVDGPPVGGPAVGRGGPVRVGGGPVRVGELLPGALPSRLAPVVELRRGPSDDEGGPGDSPASVAWLHGSGTSPNLAVAGSAARAIGSGAGLSRSVAATFPSGPLAGPPEAPERPPSPAGTLDHAREGASDASDGSSGGAYGLHSRGFGNPSATAEPRAGLTAAASSRRHAPHSSVARVEPEPPPTPRGGSTAGLSPWERWLELCARIDGFPRHLSIHTGGMLVTRAPLVDIAPLERATMPGRVVVQYDKRDVETIKLIKLDLLGLRMLSAIDDALRDIVADCAVQVDLDRLPEDLPEVFAMIQAADTVGVFQVESRAQMQTLPRSRPTCLDDLVVEVAIIRPGPIQGNAVHPYLRRRQGREPVSYLHPSLEPILAETLGVILYQEQVMRIAIEVAGFTPAGSDGFRRAMGTWRSTREMEKLHAGFVEGCIATQGLTREQAEELYRQCAAFASFGFNKSHAAAFARTAYESAFLKLYYPAQFVTGLINAQPMGFYPVEVLINDAKRHGVAVLPVDVNRSRYRTTTEWVGLAGEPLPEGAGIERRPRAVRSSGCVVPDAAARRRYAAESARGYGIRLGLHLVKGIGEEQAERLDAERERGPYRSLADVVERTGLSEEVVERLIRAGALDSLGLPRRRLLWQLREVVGSGRAKAIRGPAASRPLDLRLPPTEAPELPPPGELERLGDSYAILSLDARRQVVELFRPALDRLGAVPNGLLVDRRPGRVAVGGLVVTRQHPMTARGTVFLALEDETGMVNVTLWPDTWARLRGVVRRHALLYVEGHLERDADVVNVIAREVRSLTEVARAGGGPSAAPGVRALGYAGMRRG